MTRRSSLAKTLRENQGTGMKQRGHIRSGLVSLKVTNSVVEGKSWWAEAVCAFESFESQTVIQESEPDRCTEHALSF